MQSETAERLLQAESIDQVIQIVDEYDSDCKWFMEWRDAFRDARLALSRFGVAKLAGEDSLIGWTLANVLKRIELPESALDEVRRLTSQMSPTVRWRAVHLLGA